MTTLACTRPVDWENPLGRWRWTLAALTSMIACWHYIDVPDTI